MAAAFSNVLPFFKEAVIPVARKLWLPIFVIMAAAFTGSDMTTR